jgi:hypothetical protein
MKRNLFFLAILIISLISLVSAFESDVYSINTDVTTEGININVGDDSIIVNVTTECNSGETTCSGTNYYICVDEVWVNQGNVNGYCGYTTPTAQTTGGGSSKGTRNNFLSSIKGLFTDDEEEKEDSPKKQDEETDETPKEETIFSSLMNAAVIGVSDFVKTPAGIATFTIVGLFVVGGITFLAVKGKFKKLLPKKEENTTEQ